MYKNELWKRAGGERTSGGRCVEGGEIEKQATKPKQNAMNEIHGKLENQFHKRAT